MDETLRIGAPKFFFRLMLRNMAPTVGGVAALAATGGGIKPAVAQTKVSHKLVGYQNTPHGSQQRDNCLQFLPPSWCKVSDGTVDPAGWCKVYVKKLA